MRVHHSAYRKARVVLTRDILGFSAVGDPTLKHMSDHINLEEIQAAYEVEGDEDMVEIVTLEDGNNSGRIYQIHTSFDQPAEVCRIALPSGPSASADTISLSPCQTASLVMFKVF